MHPTMIRSDLDPADEPLAYTSCPELIAAAAEISQASVLASRPLSRSDSA